MVLGKNKTEKPVKKTEKKSSAAKPVTNPVDIVAQINAISPKMTTNKLYGGYNNSFLNSKKKFNIDYIDFIKKICSLIEKQSSFQDFYNEVHDLLTNVINTSYTGIGLYNNKSNSIHLKVLSKSGATYTSRIFKNDTESGIIKAFEENKKVILSSSEFLNNPYIDNTSVGIFPLSHNGEKCGVFLAGDEQINSRLDIYEIVNKLLSLYVLNEQLVENKNLSSDIDALTGLASHGAFQEKLADEIKKASTMKTELSVVIFDINSISQINRELGHAKGDEIIRTVADKIAQSSSDKSLIGRYGGDEIAAIMPNTSVEEAKYFAEYVAYSLSCCLIDNVGPIRVSIGISSYPENTQDQEKLLIMAEQAMYISQSKGYQHGMATIVSSQDFDFWDDMALSSFASVLTKRHAQVGISFEEELVKKFHNEEIISQHHLLDVVTSLASAIDAKDTYTKGHSTGVARYSEALARAYGLEEKEIERIKLGAVLHDVGKIGIPEQILRKPTSLSDEEWQIMKQHPTIGVEKVIKPNRQLHDLIPMVKYHHERYDGKGYPEGIKGTDIPLAARIVSVADAYHALVSDRPYRKGMSIEQACDILQEGAGTQWDKELVRIFVSIAYSLPVL
ncbi:diguanylate cyclase [bacterium]|nr:diguanylate cyclase [bacterium]